MKIHRSWMIAKTKWILKISMRKLKRLNRQGCFCFYKGKCCNIIVGGKSDERFVNVYNCTFTQAEYKTFKNFKHYRDIQSLVHEWRTRILIQHLLMPGAVNMSSKIHRLVHVKKVYHTFLKCPLLPMTPDFKYFPALCRNMNVYATKPPKHAKNDCLN